MERIHSFPPIVDENCRVLVLGTMPGRESLRQQRYYAFGPNALWRIIFALYGLPCPEDYDQRVAFLLEKHIALWDVLHSCERQGTSADADIRAPQANDFVWLFETYPRIQHVFFNGNGAARLFHRHVLPVLSHCPPMSMLPSTSPAYAKSFEFKLEGWKPLIQ